MDYGDRGSGGSRGVCVVEDDHDDDHGAAEDDCGSAPDGDGDEAMKHSSRRN